MVKTFLLIINFMKHSLLWKLVAISRFKFSGIYEMHIRTGCKGFFPENVFASLALIITVRLFWQLGRDHLTLGRDQWLWEETNDGWKRQMTNWKRQLFLNGDRLFDNGKDYCRIGKTSPPYLMDTNHKKNSSEWVGARVAQSLCERKKDRAKQTFTPSDRVLRPRPNRTTPAGPEVQAVSGVIATVKSGSKKIQSIIQPEVNPNRKRNSRTHISKINYWF